MKHTLLIIGLLMATFSANAQMAKFGHIDTQELLASMPERLTVQAQIEEQANMYEQELLKMQGSFETDYREYIDKAESWPAAIRQQKESELQQDQAGLEQFTQTVQQEMATLEAQLLSPMIERARVAIEELGAEQGFTYIFDTSTGGTVWNGGVDVLPLVKSKLGI
jgi:outer membrane protein